MIRLKNICKCFNGNYVLKNINFEIEDGKIYGIIGANGSGKSTLMNILNGNDIIEKTGGYEGVIEIDNNPVRFHNRNSALNSGIAMVHQELTLFSDMKVYENIKINREETKFKLNRFSEFEYRDKKKNIEDAKIALKSIGMDTDVERLISCLSLSEMQFIEIARELENKDIRLLILDEPTSSLNVRQTEVLFDAIRGLVKKGVAVIFISHRMEEIIGLCDFVSILRDGEMVATYPKSLFCENKFADDMIGQKVVKASRSGEYVKGEELIRYESMLDDKGVLSLHRGEILGVTGLAGQGYEDFAQGLFGLKEAYYKAYHKGKLIKDGDIETLVENKIYYLSEDRRNTSLLFNSPVWKNIIFGTEKEHPEFLMFSLLGSLSFYNMLNIGEYTKNMIRDFDIVCKGIEQKVGELSGGNQQKICVSRAITFNPDILYIGEPTRGIDINAKELILNCLLDLNHKGKTIVIFSGELEELARVCHRIAVVNEGKIFRVFDGAFNIEELSLALYGRCDNEA